MGLCSGELVFCGIELSHQLRLYAFVRSLCFSQRFSEIVALVHHLGKFATCMEQKHKVKIS
jgi:hypothetical protein